MTTNKIRKSPRRKFAFENGITRIGVTLNKKLYEILKEEATSEERKIGDYIGVTLKCIFQGNTILDIDKIIEKHRFKRFSESSSLSDLTNTTPDEDEGNYEEEMDELLAEWKRKVGLKEIN